MFERACSLLKPPFSGKGVGVYVHGLLLEGGGWDYDAGLLTEPTKNTTQPFPVTLFLPVVSDKETEMERHEDVYNCPVYATAARGSAG